MDAMENLLTRRSIRKYKRAQITQEELDAVLRAGTFAATARGTQSPLMVAVQSSEDITLMSALNAHVWGNDAMVPFYGAPTVVVVFADGDNPNGVQDASLVMGNLMHAAHALGLGSCWVNRAKEVFEMPEGKSLLKKWGVSGNWVGVGNCILGYPNEPAAAPKPRKDGYYIKIK